MPDEVLLTLLQVSDLHFGSLTHGSTVEELDSSLPILQKVLSMSDGLLGHHRAGLSDLHRFYQDLLEELDGPLCVVNSGDLTACGGSRQFKLATDFLGQEKPTQFGFGLGLADWIEHTVPGNHDQWPGSNLILGGPGRGLTRALPKRFPAIGPLRRLNKAAAVRLLYVDSDADVGHVSWDRLLARGSFVSQLGHLTDRMPAGEPGEIRVLVVHHAVSSIGTPWSQKASPFPCGSQGKRRPLEIDRGTLRVLQHFLVRHRIRVVLTGHLHIPRLGRFIASDDVEALEILEARCGTTTQWDYYPPEILKDVAEERRLPPNSLVRHELVNRSGKFVWSARIYWRSKNGGFVHSLDHVSGCLPPSLSDEFDLFG